MRKRVPRDLGACLSFPSIFEIPCSIFDILRIKQRISNKEFRLNYLSGLLVPHPVAAGWPPEAACLCRREHKPLEDARTRRASISPTPFGRPTRLVGAVASRREYTSRSRCQRRHIPTSDSELWAGSSG